MDSLPAGTVTMLFSDIEGSTLLLQRLGPLWASTLDDQRRLLRSAWRAHGGIEMGTEGDSFFVVFESAGNAVDAALEGQGAIAEHQWANGERVRVRMGLHTGAPLRHGDGYVGIDVHRAARIAASAHGGQVVVSRPTHDLIAETVGVVDLGTHYLKDLPEAERLYQVFAPGSAETFAPLKSMGTTSSLPAVETDLVGRDGELAELKELVGSADVRLVTLTGPGGTGKTRLSIGLARSLAEQPARYPDGVYFVPLGDVTTEDGMWAKIGEILGVPPAQRASGALLERLARWQALLVLDNLEQLPDADVVASALVGQAPQITMVATSRTPLHLLAEHEHAVPTLTLPDDDSPGSVERSGAVRMFVQHARRVRPGFAVSDENAADLAAICRRLDGLPLALELSAARSKVLGPRAILARLDSALDLRSPRAETPDRQRTLRETIDWSYRLLTPEQQTMVRQLGVFAGGGDLDAVEAITNPEGGSTDPLEVLSALVDASLVIVSEGVDGEPRFGMLETIRAFARELQAEVGESSDVQDRHLRHYASVASRLHEQYDGPRYVDVLAAFEREFDNLQQALDWARSSIVAVDDDRLTGALEIGVWTSAFLYRTRSHQDATQWLEAVLDLSGGVDHPLAARALSMRAAIGMRVGDPVGGLAFAQQAAEMSRRTGDDAELAFALSYVAMITVELNGAEAARPAAVESLAVARRSGDIPTLWRGLMATLSLVVEAREFEAGREVAAEMREVARQLNEPTRLLEAQQATAWIMQGLRRPEDALKAILETIRSTIALGLAYRGALTTIAYDYASILAELGDALGAARLLGAADSDREGEGWERTRSEIDDFEELVAPARQTVSPEEWDRAYAAGRLLGMREAIETVDTWDRDLGQ